MQDYIISNWIEILGVITGLVYLYQEIKASIYMWITGIIMPVISLFVYYEVGLYADFGINIYDCGSAIAIEAQSNVETLQVYSLDGAVIYTASPAATTHSIATLNPGLYIVKATLQSGQSATAKVIVR